MKKVKMLAAALGMLLCLIAAPQKGFAQTTVQGQISVSGLGQVQSLKAGVCTTKSVNLHWLPVAGAYGYEVCRAEARNGNYILLGTVPASGSLAFMNTTVMPGREYYYKVRAFVGSKNGRVYGKFSKILRANTKSLTPKKVRVKYNSNIRKYPGTNYKRMFGVPAGTELTVLCESRDKAGMRWYRIKVKVGGKKRTGYIRSDLVL